MESKEYTNTLREVRMIHKRIRNVRYAMQFVNNNNNARMTLNTMFQRLRQKLTPLEERLFVLERNHHFSASNFKGLSLLISVQRIAKKTAQQRRRRNANRASMRRALVVGAHHSLPPGLLIRFPVPPRVHRRIHRHPTTRSVTGLLRQLRRF